MEIKKLLVPMIVIGFGTTLLIFIVLTNTALSNFAPYFGTDTCLKKTTLKLPHQDLTGDKVGYYVNVDNFLPPVKAESDKYIIYQCKKNCGGMGDRERGILVAYVVSQMLRRNFGIVMEKKCEFSKYVVPNLVNWIVNNTLIENRTVGSKGKVEDWGFGRQMRESNLEDIYNKDVMYYHGNLGVVGLLMNKTSFLTLPWTKSQSQSNIYRIAFGHLFKLAPATEKKYLEFRRMAAGKQLVCAHLRMGRSKTIPNDSNLRHKPNISTVIRFLRGKVSNCSNMFIATDSDEVRVQMRNAFPSQYMEVAGPIVHVDRYRGVNACSGMEKAVLDQFILSRCDTLLISRSGFSAYSALIRGSKQNLYLVKGSKISVTSLLCNYAEISFGKKNEICLL